MRKLILALIPVIFLSIATKAQDFIYMKDGSEYKAKVEEITPETIKFKKFDQPDGPVRTVKVEDVVSIKYQDGTEEVFGKNVEDTKVNEVEKENDTQQYVYTYEEAGEEKPVEKPKSKFEMNGHNRYISLGGGFGNSYGGVGTRFQFRVGHIVGFGLHCGFGIYPRLFDISGTGSFQKRLTFDLGLKIFCYKWIYVDFQLGIMGRDGGYYLYDIRKSANYNNYDDPLIGPAILAGADYIFGKHLGVNIAAGVSFPIKDIRIDTGPFPETKTDIFPAIDAGVFYKF